MAIVIALVGSLVFLAMAYYPDCESGVCVEISFKCQDGQHISEIHFEAVNISAERKNVTYFNQTTSTSGKTDPETSETWPLDAKGTMELDWEVAQGTVRKVRVEVDKKVLATEEIGPQSFCFQQ